MRRRFDAIMTLLLRRVPSWNSISLCKDTTSQTTRGKVSPSFCSAHITADSALFSICFTSSPMATRQSGPDCRNNRIIGQLLDFSQSFWSLQIIHEINSSVKAYNLSLSHIRAMLWQISTETLYWYISMFPRALRWCSLVCQVYGGPRKWYVFPRKPKEIGSAWWWYECHWNFWNVIPS